MTHYAKNYLTERDPQYAEDGTPMWQVDQDSLVSERVRELIASLIAIGPAVSRTEIETALRKVRDERRYAYTARVHDALDDVEWELEFWRKRFIEGGFSHEAMAHDLPMTLEDLPR